MKFLVVVLVVMHLKIPTNMQFLPVQPSMSAPLKRSPGYKFTVEEKRKKIIFSNAVETP